jgi:hypothetical protein
MAAPASKEVPSGTVMSATKVASSVQFAGTGGSVGFVSAAAATTFSEMRAGSLACPSRLKARTWMDRRPIEVGFHFSVAENVGCPCGDELASEPTITPLTHNSTRVTPAESVAVTAMRVS